MPVLRDLICHMEKDVHSVDKHMCVFKCKAEYKRPKARQPDSGRKPQGSTVRAQQHTMSGKLVGIHSRLTKPCIEGVAASCAGQESGRLPRVSENSFGEDTELGEGVLRVPG